MTHHSMKRAALSALAIAAASWAGPALAATDYLLKLEGVPGESKVAGAGGGAAPHVKKEKWIELESVQLGTARTAGGVTVAAGDVNGDGVKAPRDVATGQSSSKRTHDPIRISSSRESSAPSVSEIVVTRDQQTAALLLPAVQKIREAAARMTPWTGCAAGQHIGSVSIRQISTGREGIILDAVVTTCATESLSFNFTKIEWK